LRIVCLPPRALAVQPGIPGTPLATIDETCWLVAPRADSSDLINRAFFGILEDGKRLFSIKANMLSCRRDVFEEASGFDERLHHAQDHDFLVRLQRRGVPVGHLDRAWISTSPRRLHQGPLRIGLLRVFARWSLGHAGIWRDRPC
jgi:GT2 family glycosyltransferase